MHESKHWPVPAPQRFLAGSDLPQRWQSRRVFTVCDSQFDLGQRFVALWQAWRADPNRPERLHFLAFDPVWSNTAEFASAWFSSGLALPSPLVEQLLAAWVDPLPGVSRFDFDEGRVTLTLFHAPLKQAVTQASARVDAFFLGANMAELAQHEPGFSPFGQLVRMAAAQASVYADCGGYQPAIWRGLKNAGFLCEALSATVLKARLRPSITHARSRGSAGSKVAVIGAGIAGAGVAHALALRGHEVVVFDAALAGSPQGVHQGHVAAAVTPVVSRDDDYRARLSRAGARLSWQRWRHLPEAARPSRPGTAVIAANDDDQARLHEALHNGQYASRWVQWHGADWAKQALGVATDRPVAWFPEGMVIRPGRLIEALLAPPKVQCVAQHVALLRPAGEAGWHLYDASGQLLTAAQEVVLANAAQMLPLMRRSELTRIPPRLAAMQNIAGQVSYFDALHIDTAMSCVLDGKGYWLPAVEGVHVGGGTYDLDAIQPRVSAQGHVDVIKKIGALLPGSSDERLHQGIVGGWAGWRAVVPGRLPVVGEMQAYPGLWLACAYGSRGLTWSALAADVIGCALNDEPAPLERELLRAIAPR